MSGEKDQSLAVGGQALIEGVMMRSGGKMVICVRQPDNEIATHTIEIKNITKRVKPLGLPFIRGIAMLFETMYYGVKSMMYSANVALEEEDEEFGLFDYILLIVMLVVMNGVFIAVPFILTNWLGLTGIIFNIVESLVKFAMFTVYLWGISKWGEVARVLQYHGAEHKTINAYEAGADLNAETVASFSRLNPRCGTSFLFLTVLVSMTLYAFIPTTTFALRLGYRLALMPLIAGASYEVLKLSDKYRDSSIMKLIIKPGLAFQAFTTQEPTNEMIEVAIMSLKKVKGIETSE